MSPDINPDMNTDGSEAGRHAGQPTPAEIEADIERQREQLADTVSALQDKLDVKARAQYRAAELRDRATTDTGKPRPELVAAGVGAVAFLGVLVWWRRRTRS